MKSEVLENCLLLKLDLHFNPADPASFGCTLLRENYMRSVPKKKHSRMMPSSEETGKVEVIGLDGEELEMVPPKKAAKIIDNSKPNWLRMTKNGTTLNEPENKSTEENTTEKPTGNIGVFEIPVVRSHRLQHQRRFTTYILALMTSRGRICRVATRNYIYIYTYEVKPFVG